MFVFPFDDVIMPCQLVHKTMTVYIVTIHGVSLCITNLTKQFNFYIGRKSCYIAFLSFLWYIYKTVTMRNGHILVEITVFSYTTNTQKVEKSTLNFFSSRFSVARFFHIVFSYTDRFDITTCTLVASRGVFLH
jgi:hypothetical protein